MKHSQACECATCESEHPKLVLWRIGSYKATSVELRESTWYVNYVYTKSNKTGHMKLYEWNIQAIQHGN